jgi:ABC-type multidrug transport system fused ATPase/permease subunit
VGVAARRTAHWARLATLHAVASSRLRVALVATALLSTASKVLAVFIAIAIAGGDVREAGALGVVVAVLFALARVVGSGARVTAQCDLQLGLARALLDSDVLVEPTSQPLRNLPEPAFHAGTLMTDTVPELAASVLAAVVVAPLLASRLSVRAVVVSGVAVVVAMAALVTLARLSVALQTRVMRAQQDMLERVGFAIEGRLELVARGAEGAALGSIGRSVEHYRGVARRGGFTGALLGRAPLAAGLGSVILVVLFDASYREAVTSTVLAQALVLAACIPILLGVVLRANEVTRLSALVAPVVEVLRAPRRPELAAGSKEAPALPATFVATGVTFAYRDEGAPTLRDVSFEWSPGTALIIEGPNGAGKSTLLRLLLGLRAPQAGSLTLGGVELAELDLRLLRRRIAYLPQRPYLGEPSASIGAALRALDDSVREDELRDALSRVGLGSMLSPRGEILEVPVGELSAGQRQRLGLARLLLQHAEIYLLDEPDANLDHAGLALVVQLIGELVARGSMVAIAAHTAELSAGGAVRVRLS